VLVCKVLDFCLTVFIGRWPDSAQFVFINGAVAVMLQFATNSSSERFHTKVGRSRLYIKKPNDLVNTPSVVISNPTKEHVGIRPALKTCVIFSEWRRASLHFVQRLLPACDQQEEATKIAQRHSNFCASFRARLTRNRHFDGALR
jgi:hypothetical protein